MQVLVVAAALAALDLVDLFRQEALAGLEQQIASQELRFITHTAEAALDTMLRLEMREPELLETQEKAVHALLY
jgi:hypothetical protein